METTWIPGMAARDPETGVRWRKLAIGWACEGNSGDGRGNSLERARAAGPDLADFSTAAAYAAQRGWDVERMNDGTARVWTGCFTDKLRNFRAATLPDAVQAAAKAEGER